MSEDRPTVRAFDPGDAGIWDEFVAASLNGTFLHSRRFLSYHADRFHDLSLLVLDSRARVIGLLPAAAGSDSGTVDSHPGITYGGLVHHGLLVGDQAIAALQAAATYYRDHGYRMLRYRAIPRPYFRETADDDSYALFRLNANRTRVDLAAGFVLAARKKPSHGRLHDLKEAAKHGVVVEIRSSSWPEFWVMLEGLLASRYATRPVHSLAEIIQLSQLFPEEIELILARVGSEVVAGTVLFHTARVTHTQYLASSPNGRELGALSKVVEAAIERAQELGRACFSIGTSNEDGGRVLNVGLYQWKLSFGSGSFVHETFELPL